MLVDLTAVSRAWAVLRVKPRHEEMVTIQLDREGLESYCPFFKRRPSDLKARPLFPGYIFLWASPALELPAVRHMPGLRGPLLFREQVACIEEEVVENWKVREGGKGYMTPPPKPPFQPGQQVRLKEGPFAGFEGTVLESLPAKERVRLLLEYLGSTIRLEVEAGVVE